MSSTAILCQAGSLVLRPEAANGADEPFLFALFTSTKAPEMALMPVGEAVKEHLLRMQYRSMTATYHHQYPTARFEIVMINGQDAGRLITDVNAERVYYVDIAIMPQLQGGGVATALMNAVLREPKRLGIPGRVKVMGSNAASLRLCQKVGFTVTAREPPYVDLEWRAP